MGAAKVQPPSMDATQGSPMPAPSGVSAAVPFASTGGVAYGDTTAPSLPGDGIVPAVDSTSVVTPMNNPTQLQEFINTLAIPVQPPLISTPLARKKKKAGLQAASPRRSGRIAIKKKSRQLSDGADAIQEIIARVCGILAPEASFDDASHATFNQLFLKVPLPASAIQALDALVKQVKKLKLKKSDQAKSKATTVKTKVANV